MNTPAERLATLNWANAFKPVVREIPSLLTLGSVRSAFEFELKGYFALACLSRHQSEARELVAEAYNLVFRVRCDLEQAIALSISNVLERDPNHLGILWSGSFFGASKKQGTSVRMPLTTCQPTVLCAPACYAHDVLDAAPASLIRGVINGLVASNFENGDQQTQNVLMAGLRPHTLRAVHKALKETQRLPEGFSRRPNIRFAHVGEIACYPNFANALARQVFEISQSNVDCVVYTRHMNATKLDRDLWVVNFTLDEKSMNRKPWIPKWARVVFSAFGGKLRPDAEVNFLEHHRWSHIPPVGGAGAICPATHPQTKVRTCDASRCALCFNKPV
jgi:hypothetical protein